jgi:hypothetical protein
VTDIAQSDNQGLTRRGLFKSSLIVGLGAAGLTAGAAALTAGVAHATNEAAYALTDRDVTIAFTTQTNWRYCNKCRNLYYSPEGGELCAAGGTHTTTSQTVYQVPDQRPSYSVASGSESHLQSPWLWCRNCSCLFWGPEESTSWCPERITVGVAGQLNHDGSASGAYYLPNGVESNGDYAWTGITSLQAGWRYCGNCKDLYWGGAWASSQCYYALFNGFDVNNGNNGYGHAPGNTVYYVFD